MAFERRVWVPDANEGYLLGQVVDISESTMTVNCGSKGTVDMPYDAIYPAEENEEKTVDDNCESFVELMHFYTESTTVRMDFD